VALHLIGSLVPSLIVTLPAPAQAPPIPLNGEAAEPESADMKISAAAIPMLARLDTKLFLDRNLFLPGHGLSIVKVARTVRQIESDRLGRVRTLILRGLPPVRQVPVSDGFLFIRPVRMV